MRPGGSLPTTSPVRPAPIRHRATHIHQPSLLCSLSNHGSCFQKQKKKKETKTQKHQNQPTKQNDLSPEGLESSQKPGLCSWESVEKCQIRNGESRAHHGLLSGTQHRRRPPGKASSFQILPAFFFSVSFCYIDWNSPKKRWLDFRGFRTVSSTQ